MKSFKQHLLKEDTPEYVYDPPVELRIPLVADPDRYIQFLLWAFTDKFKVIYVDENGWDVDAVVEGPPNEDPLVIPDDPSPDDLPPDGNGTE